MEIDENYSKSLSDKQASKHAINQSISQSIQTTPTLTLVPLHILRSAQIGVCVKLAMSKRQEARSNSQVWFRMLGAREQNPIVDASQIYNG
jgi:hypothetical protein